jgi:hypothetical protein
LLWFFRNRQTGAITVAQAPNVVLWIAIVAAGAKWIWSPEGVLGTTLGMVVTGSLLLWAADEIARGVNPWRRCLGLAVGAYELAGIVSRYFNMGHG